MAKSTFPHPQFILTLDLGFQTHLTIPLDFFSKYINGKSLNQKTAELKSDSSEVTWKVKMIGPILIGGWKEFAVAHDLQIGHVIVFRYEGDMVFHVSDFGPNFSKIPDDDQEGNMVHSCSDLKSDLNKKPHPITEECVQELHIKKKAKKISHETGASSDNSCFVASVTALDLRTDMLYLPQDFTSSNGFTTNCDKIVIIDRGERSWALDLRLDESSDTFFLSNGWRNFCYENRQKDGGSFSFRLAGNGETPVLRFSPTEQHNVSTQTDCSIEVNNEEVDQNMCIQKRIANSYSSYTPCCKTFVTFTLPPDYNRIRNLSLPASFVRENSLNKPGEIILLGEDGIKWSTNLFRDNKGTMRLGKGWKEFVKANGLESGFTVKLIWEDTTTTPQLSLCSDRERKECLKSFERQPLIIDSISKDENNRRKDSIPLSQRRFVTFKLTTSCFVKRRLNLPAKFVRENGLNNPGMIYLLGKDGTKLLTKLKRDTQGVMSLGKDWEYFGKANNLKSGQTITLELIWEDATPMLSWISIV